MAANISINPAYQLALSYLASPSDDLFSVTKILTHDLISEPCNIPVVRQYVDIRWLTDYQLLISLLDGVTIGGSAAAAACRLTD